MDRIRSGPASGRNLSLPETYAETGLPGVPGEFVRRCEQYCGAKLLNHYFRDTQVISYVSIQMMREAGVELLLNTFASDPVMKGNKITGLIVENKSGPQVVLAKVVIDATGDADVAARAGAPVNIGGESSFNPGLYFAIGNVDIDRFEKEVIRRDSPEEDVQWVRKIHPSLDKPLKQLTTLAPYYRKAWEAGEYRFLRSIENGRWTLLCDHGIFRSPVGRQFEPDPLRKDKYGLLGALVGIHGPWDQDVVTSSSRHPLYETAGW